jgi:hypothetical protein
MRLPAKASKLFISNGCRRIGMEPPMQQIADWLGARHVRVNGTDCRSGSTAISAQRPTIALSTGDKYAADSRFIDVGFRVGRTLTP